MTEETGKPISFLTSLIKELLSLITQSSITKDHQELLQPSLLNT